MRGCLPGDEIGLDCLPVGDRDLRLLQREAVWQPGTVVIRVHVPRRIADCDEIVAAGIGDSAGLK